MTPPHGTFVSEGYVNKYLCFELPQNITGHVLSCYMPAERRHLHWTPHGLRVAVTQLGTTSSTGQAASADDDPQPIDRPSIRRPHLGCILILLARLYLANAEMAAYDVLARLECATRAVFIQAVSQGLFPRPHRTESRLCTLLVLERCVHFRV